MSGEISLLSAIIITISSGLIGVIITNITSSCIATRNRKVQSELTLKELEQKEKIEYRKMGIDFINNKVKHLNEWNLSIYDLTRLNACLVKAETSKDPKAIDSYANEIGELFRSRQENIHQLVMYLPIEKGTQIAEIFKNSAEKYAKALMNKQGSFWKAKISIESLIEAHGIVTDEIMLLLEKTNKIVDKYID